MERFTLPGGRGELMQVGDLTILNDCYNANPQSFRAAIATASSLRGGRRLVFVAGTMRELGADAESLHAEVARDAGRHSSPICWRSWGISCPRWSRTAAQLGERLVTARRPAGAGAAPERAASG